MILKIAWKNIWRNKVRSAVVIAAIALGVWAVIFINSLTAGITRTYIHNAVNYELSHLQIHNPEYLNERKLSNSLDKDFSSIQTIPGIYAWTERMLVDGMISSSKTAQGTVIRGIDPDLENAVTNLKELIIEGTYFEEKNRNPILIGKDIATKLNVKLRQKVVLTFQAVSGDIVAGSFRIAGIFESKNGKYEGMNVFVKKTDLERINEKSGSHEIAIMLDDISLTDQVQSQLKSRYQDFSIRNYKEISPDIDLYDSQIKINQIVITIIIMLALIFGIINTMLMAVLERIRELGMLMAVGMNKIKVFLMIVFETTMLGIVGAPIGMLLGLITVNYFNNKGIDLSNYSEGMKQFGITEMLYPYLDSQVFLEIGLAVMITALLASIYPALKAIRLKPVEAIRSI